MIDGWVAILGIPGGSVLILFLGLFFGLIEIRPTVKRTLDLQTERLKDKDLVISQGAEREASLRETVKTDQETIGHLTGQINELMPTAAVVRRILEAIEPLLLERTRHDQ